MMIQKFVSLQRSIGNRLTKSIPTSIHSLRRRRSLSSLSSSFPPDDDHPKRPKQPPPTIEELTNKDVNVIINKLPKQFLRDASITNYNPSTFQRTDIHFDNETGKPIIIRNPKQNDDETYDIVNCTIVVQDDEEKKKEKEEKKNVHITWSDGMISTFSMDWIENQLNRWNGTEIVPSGVIPWRDLSEEKVRNSSMLSMNFSNVIGRSHNNNEEEEEDSNEGMRLALKALYQYGILLVTDTPIDDNGAGIAALGAALGGGSVKEMSSMSVLENYRRGGDDVMLPFGTDGPLRTLYGTVWSTSSGVQAEGASVADSAYGEDGLPLHTDMTYIQHPPGLQIFTMIQPAKEGGESVFGDGFAVAKHLKETNLDAFNTLSSTNRRYRCRDADTGWNLEATGPVIELDQYNKNRIVRIRHNDLDRLADLPPKNTTTSTEREGEEEIDMFYKQLRQAHIAWDEILQNDSFRLVMKLQPGDTMIVANQVSFSPAVVVVSLACCLLLLVFVFRCCLFFCWFLYFVFNVSYFFYLTMIISFLFPFLAMTYNNYNNTNGTFFFFPFVV